jgi:vacuolar-type H+-ATPase subunit I/STV1
MLRTGVCGVNYEDMDKKTEVNKMKKVIIGIITLLVIVAGGCGYYFGVYLPREKAVTQFDNAKKKVEIENKKLQILIDGSEKLINSKKEAYDTSALDKLKSADDSAKKALVSVPKVPKKTDAIEKATKELEKPIDYSIQISELKSASEAFESSVKQLKQITNPTSDFVIQRLKEVSSITGTQAVTENNDPNGNLNKQSGYTAAVYFTDKDVTEEVDGRDIVDKGTDAGGCIEVYPTKKDAETRNAYLAAFDGAEMFNSGSHEVHGTVVIRTSANLTASQQKDLTKQILGKLIELK